MKKRNPQEKSKFLSYFDLWDAFREPGCPICTRLERCSFNYLDSLLYERVNDVGTRIKLGESLGFCNWHAWKCLEVSNCSLGLGIIYDDILRRIEERLRKVKNFFPFRIPFLRKLLGREKTAHQPPYVGPDQRCPVCAHVQFFENIYLSILLDFIAEEDLAKQYRHSAGICFPHLVRAIERYPSHVNLHLLIEKQIEKYEFLRIEIAEFIRKQDYQYTDEPSGPEVNSWRRALEMAVGKREVFSSHMGGMVGFDPSVPPSSPIEGDTYGSNSEERGIQQDMVEQLKFENEKLERKYEEIKAECAKESTRASSLHHIAWKMSEDNKVLKMSLEKANAQAQEYAEHIERLNKEIESLKELLKTMGQYDNVRDEGAADKIMKTGKGDSRG